MWLIKQNIKLFIKERKISWNRIINDFKFRINCRDQLPTLEMKDLMNIIVNSGKSSEKGLYHWTCVFKNNNEVISFCSLGSRILADILDYFKKYNILTSK